MASHEDKIELLTALARLRDAQRELGSNADLRAVRAVLERQLGPTVKRALAARALGVSQPALDRWIDHGDIPTVLTPDGKHEVPVPALVDLVAAVESERQHGERFPLAAALNGRRVAANELDMRRVVRGTADKRGHRLADARALAYHRAVAQRLDDDIVERARERLAVWRATEKVAPEYATRWEALLERPPSEIGRVISRDDESGRDLRQNSPFAGLLSEPARRRVLAAVG